MVDERSISARVVGVELYFDDLEEGKQFYGNTLGCKLLDEEEGHHAQFGVGDIFVCLERKGVESYPSRDKAVIFLEVADLAETIRRVGKEKFVAIRPEGESQRRSWAALHDPEGYNIVLIEASNDVSSA